MALSGWRWAGVAAAGMVLAGRVLLPPRPMPERTGELAELLGLVYGVPSAWRGPHRWTLRQTLNRLRTESEQARRADSLRALARGGRAIRSPDGLLTVVHEPPISRDSARQWLLAAAGELDVYPPVGTGGVPVIIALYSDSARRVRRGERIGRRSWRTRRFLDSSGTRPICIVEVNLMTLRARRRAGYGGGEMQSLRRRVLDSCALYARYGMPGPHIAAWARFSYPEWLLHEGLAQLVRQAGRRLPPRELFEAELPFLYDWVLKGCLRGGESLCVRLVGMGRSDFRFARAVWWVSRHAELRRDLLALLVARGDGQRFAAFWRSARPPAEALAAAYGESAGRLVSGLMRRVYVAPDSGPLTAPRNIVAALGWAVVAVAFALLTARRRQSAS